MNDQISLSVITSTGRTGTLFFRDYLSRTCSRTLCLHEPPPSRIFKFFSNLTLENKIPQRLAGYLYKAFRISILTDETIDNYIESNNFLFGCIPSMNIYLSNIKVVHLVRHPVNYAISHMGHGFWKGHKKFFSKRVPFWLENIQHATDDPFKLLFLRWCLVNKTISELKASNPYLLVKFEDLFSSDPDTANMTLNTIREFLGFSELSCSANREWLSVPKNKSNTRKKPEQIEQHYSAFLDEFCQDQIIEFDYRI